MIKPFIPVWDETTILRYFLNLDKKTGFTISKQIIKTEISNVRIRGYHACLYKDWRHFGFCLHVRKNSCILPEYRTFSMLSELRRCYVTAIKYIFLEELHYFSIDADVGIDELFQTDILGGKLPKKEEKSNEQVYVLDEAEFNNIYNADDIFQTSKEELINLYADLSGRRTVVPRPSFPYRRIMSTPKRCRPGEYIYCGELGQFGSVYDYKDIAVSKVRLDSGEITDCWVDDLYKVVDINKQYIKGEKTNERQQPLSDRIS